MIQEIRNSSPDFVVLANSRVSWLRREDSFTRVFDWWRTDGSRNYQLVGVAARGADGESTYRWDNDARSNSFPEDSLVVYRRQ